MQWHETSFTELGLPHDKHRFIEVDIFMHADTASTLPALNRILEQRVTADKALANRRVFEEAQLALSAIKAEDVVDPAVYFFTRSLADYSLMARAEAKIDWAQFLARHDLVWSRLPEKWEEGAFLGNGMMLPSGPPVQDRWRPSAPAIQNGKVVFTAHDGVSVHCPLYSAIESSGTWSERCGMVKARYR